MKLLISTLLFAGVVGVANADFVNGSFETGDFTGWTTQDASSGSFYGVTAYTNLAVDQVDGNEAAYFGAVSDIPDTISQTLTTNAGSLYNLSFYVGEDGGGGDEGLQVQWNGVNYFNSAVPSVVDPLTDDYMMIHYTITVLATGSDTASFGGFDTLNFIALDNVSLTPVATPEPASFAFLGLGLAGLVVRRRRRAR
jgi:hypothetical protein